jgi:protein-S-isoprenylcysteine O-methyltransferase Ste14
MRLLALGVVGALILAALTFIPAGRLDWTAGWVCLLIMVIGFSAVTAHVMRKTPLLVRRRAKVGAGTPLWDRIVVTLFQLLFMAILIAGGLETRLRGTSLLLGWQLLGVVLMIVSMLLLGWAMGQNPHFESTVRIQHDQQHRVIDTGPYRIVRHPGYVAAILLLLGIALVLGSRWALVPAVASAMLIVVRTAMEDHFLHDQLAGYREFAQRTRFRLLPGIW